MERSEEDVVRLVLQKLESLERAGVTHVRRGKSQGKLVRAARKAPASADVDAGPSAKNSASVSAAAKPVVPARPAQERPLRPEQPSLALAGQAKAPVVDVPAKKGVQPVVVAQPERVGPPMAAEERPRALEILSREVAPCARCSELAATRTQTVFGVGNPSARLVLLGEAPGADEDKQGEPFVGRAGQLLTKIIEACTLTRNDVYILNTLKCRPPGNRNPLPEEMANCRGWLDAQLDIIRPEFICCLGSIAAKGLLNTETTIGRLRGKFYEYRGAQVICTYHPAYLLRNPSAKKDVWEDMKLLMAKMGIQL